MTKRHLFLLTRFAAGAAFLWTVLLGSWASKLGAQTFDLLYGFSSPPAEPGQVIEASDGIVYGTTRSEWFAVQGSARRACKCFR